MDIFSNVFLGCCGRKEKESQPSIHEYEELELTPYGSAREQRQWPPTQLYTRLITAEAFEEIRDSPYEEFAHAVIVHLDDVQHPLHTRVTLAVDFHDVFSLIRLFLESWSLPCAVSCRPSRDTITGVQLLALGSPATVNWLGAMLNNGELMAQYFRYAGLHFTTDSKSAVVTGREIAQTEAPPNTPRPRRIPRTQFRAEAPRSAPPRIRFPPIEVVSDSDDDSINEYWEVEATVHGYTPRGTRQGGPRPTAL